MAEVLDYYSFTGLPRTSAWEDVKKKVNKKYLEFKYKADFKGPGTKEAEQRDFWANALNFFKDEGSKKAYDSLLDAWLKSPAAQAAKVRAKSAAEDFAQRSTGALELLQQAWRELERGNVAEAMLLAGKAVVLDPGSWEAYFALGVANFRTSDLDEAMSCLRSAGRLNPKSADVRASIGEIYERQGRWKEAYEQYRLAAEIEPDVLAHQISMGLVCVKAGMPNEGIEILRACQAKDPDDPGLNWVLGLALSESARLGWNYVQDGHPRVPEGWYAMSREQALQAVEKLHEATTLRFDDPDLSKHLAELKSDVESNVKRHFTGNWILLGVIGLSAFFGPSPVATLIVGLFAVAYYVVNLVPQYAINARVLAGDHALKRGFFDWLDNLTNPWLKLVVLLGLFMLLPIFVVYWGIRNWTGSNAPLGKVVGDIQSKHKSETGTPSSGDSPAQAEISATATLSTSTRNALTLGTSAGAGTGGDVLATSAAQGSKAAPTNAKPLPSDADINTSGGGSGRAKSLTAFANANKTVILVGAVVAALVIAFSVLLFNKSQNEDRLRAELEQKAVQMRETEQRALAAAQEARQQADAQKRERERAERAEAAAASAAATAATSAAAATTRIGDMYQQPRIRVGDRHTFQTTDMLDSRLNNVVTREVVSVSGDEVTMKFVNQKSSYERLLTYNRDLGLLKSRSGKGEGVDYSPAIKYVQVPGRIGDTWTSKSNETNIKTGKARVHVIRARIDGKESVTVPAGTFETFRIVITSEVEEDGKVSNGQDTSWFSPEVGRSVKSELRSTDATGKAGHRVVQLVSYSLGQ